MLKSPLKDAKILCLGEIANMIDDERDFASPQDPSTVIRCLDGTGVLPAIDANQGTATFVSPTKSEIEAALSDNVPETPSLIKQMNEEGVSSQIGPDTARKLELEF
jgi:hypothetical protein